MRWDNYSTLGHGIDHIDGIRFRYEFQDIVLFSKYQRGRPWSLVPVRLLLFRQIDRGKSSCGFGGMLRQLTSSKNKDRQKQTPRARSPGTRTRFTNLLACFIAFRLEMLEQASPYANPASTTPPHVPTTPNTRHVHALTTRESHSRPCSTGPAEGSASR